MSNPWVAPLVFLSLCSATTPEFRQWSACLAATEDVIRRQAELKDVLHLLELSHDEREQELTLRLRVLNTLKHRATKAKDGLTVHRLSLQIQDVQGLLELDVDEVTLQLKSRLAVVLRLARETQRTVRTLEFARLESS